MGHGQCLVADAAEVERIEVGDQGPEVGRGVRHLVAERAKQGDRLLVAVDDLGRLRHRQDRLGGAGDPQLAGRGPRRLDQRAVEGRRRVEIPFLRPADRIQIEGGVHHRPADAAGDREPVPVLAVGREGDPVPLRLQAEQAAVGGGVADGAGAVSGVGDRAHPSRDRDAAAAARAGACQVGVPGIAGVAPGRALGEAVDGELGEVGLAEDHGSGVAQSPDDHAVLLRRLAVGGRAVGRDLARVVDVVLDRDRHSEQRRLLPGGEALLRPLRVGMRLLAEHDPVGVQLRLDPRDALQVELDQLAG